MIIGLTGYARAGKDTVAELFVNNGFTKMAFAEPMREALIRLNPIVTIGGQYTHLSDIVDRMGWESVKQISPEVRPLMQRMGTEVGRELFGENFWVDLAMEDAMFYNDVVFSDVRFKNEADAIVEAGGIIIRVVRDGVGPTNGHVSESDMDNYPVDYVIGNHGLPEDLYAKVNVLLASMDAWL